jgi:threonine/homoserine/homoserine lactone efflux protein
VSTLLAFLPVALLVIVTPGPDTVVTVRSALLGGRRAGLLTALGAITGQVCWTLAAAAGVTAVLLASEPVFLALKLAGALYLVYLGGQALLVAVRGVPVADGLDGAGPRRPASRATAYRQGLLSDLGNPKIGAFFTSLLPQFAGPHPGFWAMAGLGATFAILTLAWLVAYVCVVDRAAGVLRRSGVRRAIEAVTGTVLVALGLRVATEARTA